MSDPRRNDPFTELYGEFSDRLRGDRWQPDIDVFETEEAIVVLAEIAGIRAEDLRVTVDGEELRISGVRRVPERSDVKRLLQMEIAAGPFERRMRIALPFDRENVLRGQSVFGERFNGIVRALEREIGTEQNLRHRDYGHHEGKCLHAAYNGRIVVKLAQMAPGITIEAAANMFICGTGNGIDNAVP